MASGGSDSLMGLVTTEEAFLLPGNGLSCVAEQVVPTGKLCPDWEGHLLSLAHMPPSF